MLTLTMELPALAHQDAALWARVLPRFQTEAGKLIVESIRAELGSSEIYQLSEPYREQKQRRRGFKRYAGKASDQPLVFSGAMLESVSAREEGNLLLIEMAEGQALAKNGEDYAEKWEEATHFMERGFEKVEPLLADLLLTIILEEMLL